MGGFDRSKFKAASMNAISEQEKHQQTVRPSSQFNNDTHEIKDGVNWFRIAPFHPEDGGRSPFEAKCITFLEVSVPKRDENKKIIEGQFENKQKPIFNARVHGGYPIDIVEEYMKVAKEVAIPAFTSDPAKVKTIWNKVSGYDPIKKKSGVKPQDTWQCYAWDRTGKLGTLEIKKSVKDQLTELALSLSTDTTTPDPYSDVDDGIAILIEKTGEKIDTRYKVSLDRKQIDKFNTQLVPTPLTEVQLEQLSAAKSLYKRFVNSFTHKDLEYQVEGLQNFDKALAADGYNIGVFQYEQFLDAIERMYTLVPETTNEDIEEMQKEEPKENKPQPVKKTVAQTAPAPSKFVRKAPEPVEELPVAVGHEEKIVESAHISNVNDKLAALKKKMGRA